MEEGAVGIDEAILVSDVNLGKGYGTNSLALSPLNDAVLVGCENGSLRILKWDGTNLKLQITNLEFKGHIKAVCKVEFHPNQPNIVLSSAKDGTCRLWNLQMKPDEACVDVLKCQIYDAKKPPTDQKLLNPKPGQNVVKGCAFGDLEGRIVYTIQSGRKPDKTFKKKGAFLSVWKLVRRVVPVVPLVDEEPADANGHGNGNGAPPSNQHQPPQQKREVFQFEEQMRIPVSNYPASAFALSGDFSTIVIGDTDGCVTLLSTTTFKPVKYWAQVHDLPVTCISARPLPMDLAGERNFGVKVDAVSCSADNQMVFLTKQKRSTLKPVKTRSGGGGGKSGSSFFGMLFSFWNILLLLALIVFIAKVSHQVCRHEFENGHDLQEIKECVLHTVLWAPATRPGVESVPY
jgi:WD40 repeat protein